MTALHSPAPDAGRAVGAFNDMGKPMTTFDAAVRRRAMAFACLVLLVAGCAQQPDRAAESATPEFSISGAASPKPAVSATGSLSARDQQIAAGTEAIRAYRQMIFDIYADPSPNVQDMRKVATGVSLERDMEALTRGLGKGWTNTAGTVSIKWVKPVKIGKTEMQLYACVDPNGILSGTSTPPKLPAKAEAIDYDVTATDAGWRVSGTYTHGGARSVEPC